MEKNQIQGGEKKPLMQCYIGIDIATRPKYLDLPVIHIYFKMKLVFN